MGTVPPPADKKKTLFQIRNGTENQTKKGVIIAVNKANKESVIGGT